MYMRTGTRTESCQQTRPVSSRSGLCAVWGPALSRRFLCRNILLTLPTAQMCSSTFLLWTCLSLHKPARASESKSV